MAQGYQQRLVGDIKEVKDADEASRVLLGKEYEVILKLVYINAGGISLSMTTLGILHQGSGGIGEIFLIAIGGAIFCWFISICLLLTHNLLIYEHELSQRKILAVQEVYRRGFTVGYVSTRKTADTTEISHEEEHRIIKKADKAFEVESEPLFTAMNHLEKQRRLLKRTGVGLFALAYFLASIFLIGLLISFPQPML